MRRRLWPDSLRGRLILLALVCIVLFQTVNTVTFYHIQQEQRQQRVALLAQQTAEWTMMLDQQDDAQHRSSLDSLERLYRHAEWWIKLAVIDEFPPPGFIEGSEGPITTARGHFAAAFPEGQAPALHAGFTLIDGRRSLQYAARLGNGRWLCVTRIRTASLQREKVQRIVFFSEFVVFFLAMFWLLFNETRQLENLRRGVESFGESPETASALSEEGCREIRETSRSLNRMRDRVMNSIEERDRMLSALRHDLRTPLTRLQLWTEEAGPEEVRLKLQENARQIQELVSQSIQLASSLNTAEQEVLLDIRAFLESAADDYADEGRNVTFLAPEGLGVTLHTRATCLRRCLTNLIENALKYAGAAEIALIAENGTVSIEVLDRGPGIPPDKLEKVMEPWFRVETSRNRETGGSGLGLAIAKNMARLAGAVLKLEEREGGGLRAVIRFQR